MCTPVHGIFIIRDVRKYWLLGKRQTKVPFASQSSFLVDKYIRTAPKNCFYVFVGTSMMMQILP